MTSEQVTGQAQGRTIPVRPGRDEGTVRIEVLNCGHTLRLIAERTVRLDLHSLESPVYSGSLAFGGVQRSWRFEAVDPRRMTGEVVAGDGRIIVDKPMTLVFQGGGQAMEIGCESEEPTEDEPSPVSPDEAIEALRSLLRERGLTPAGERDYSDYITTGVNRAQAQEEGTRWVRLRIGHDGHVLPTLPDRIECRVGQGALEPAAYILNFKLHRYQDVHDSAVQLIEVESGVIRNQRMGEGGSGQDGMESAMDAAWNRLRLDIPIGPMTDGRTEG